VLELTLNNVNRFVRAAGTLLVAAGLAFKVFSATLAETDGTFAAVPAGNFWPQLLDTQACRSLEAGFCAPVAMIVAVSFSRHGMPERSVT
jgi:hypothetical protein